MNSRFLINRRCTQIGANDYQIEIATDPHRHPQTKLNVVTFNFNKLFAWRPPPVANAMARQACQAKNSHPAARDKNHFQLNANRNGIRLHLVIVCSFDKVGIAKRLMFLPEQIVRVKDKHSLMRMH